MKHFAKIGFLLLTIMIVAIGIPAISSVRVSAAATSVGDEEKLFAAIESGKDVKLSQSIVITSCLRIPQGKKLTLDLNGKTIDRGLRVSQDIGSVIRVEPGAELTITDSTNTNAGIITGGASWNGGGICNHGTLTIKGGTISGNLAVNDTHGGGGGIYNGSYMGSTAILTIEGGVIENNQARNGAGIYNGQGGTVIIKQGYYEKKVLGKQKKFYTNLTLRSNAALQKGSGIYNDGTLKIQDSPVIYSNKNNEDIFIAKGRKITFTGALNSEGLIGVLSEGGDPVITEDYGKYNSVSPGKLFMSSSNDYVLKLTAVNNSEIKLKNSGKTTVEVYEDDKLVRTEEYDSPQTAWDKASSYAKAVNTYYNITNPTEADPNDVIGSDLNDPTDRERYYPTCLSTFGGNWDYRDKCRVEITLGSDWSHDKQLVVKTDCHILIDLNGHAIIRTRNGKATDDGSVFKTERYARLDIRDSNPDSKGYDGIRGGVITGGAGGDCAGCIDMLSGSFVDIEGGTLYDCSSQYHGGAVCMRESLSWHSLLIMRNCRIYHCTTFDSADASYGGAIYMHDHCGVLLENMTIQDCYSEDSGGAVYMRNENTIFRARNVMFVGNKAYDNGGAVTIKENSEHFYYTFFDAENCLFSGNKANDYGGAVYVDGSVEKRPTSFRNCIFRCNESGKNGSAMYVNQKNVVLADCTLTENKTKKKGALFVEANESIGIKGLMVIKDNTSDEDSKCADLVLEDGVRNDSSVYNGGLYKGSYISVNSDSKGDMTVVKNISEYQKRYFHSTGGTVQFNKERDEAVPMVIATLFGNGSVGAIIAILILAVISAIVVITVKKKKGGQEDESTNEE